jgi:predicted phage terminase large subunit-like protein
MNGVRVYCKGLKDPDSARGPNINWLWFDEAGRAETDAAWKTAVASVRIGPNPQAWCTNTAKPTTHWTYKLFILKQISADAIKAFDLLGKKVEDIIQWFHATTDENKDNLDPEFYASLLVTYAAGAERERELKGIYVDDGGSIGDSTKIIKIKEIPEDWELGRSVRYWDMAATEKKLGKKDKNDPDECVGTLVQECFVHEIDLETGKKIRRTVYVILDQVGGWMSWETILDTIIDTAKRDGPYTKVIIEQEPASGGKNQVAAIQVHFAKNEETELSNWKVEGQRPTDRVQEANYWFGFAAKGCVYMLENEAWNSLFTEQVDNFPVSGHDDRVTSCSGAMRSLLPLFKKWNKIAFVTL